MLASAARTTTTAVPSAAFKVSTITMLMVGVDITAQSGSPALTAWLQGSDDGGTTWYDLIADHVLPSTGTDTTGTPATNVRNILTDISATGQHSAVYKHLATDYVRLMYDIDGTTVTFSVSAVGK